jgi:ElaB/YqjD/DUF883 family membrane-anchored ribosome-binding protein
MGSAQMCARGVNALPRKTSKGDRVMPTRTETGKEGLVDNASERMQEAASVAQDKAADLREGGSAQVRDQFDRRSTQAGAQMRSLAEALRRSGDDLSKEGNSGAARITGQAAERIERVGSYLEEKSGDELVRDIETFARKRPWMLAGLGLLSGVAAARLMKASSDQRSDSNREVHQLSPTQSTVHPASPYGIDGEAGVGAPLGRETVVSGVSRESSR